VGKPLFPVKPTWSGSIEKSIRGYIELIPGLTGTIRKNSANTPAPMDRVNSRNINQIDVS
jgi:hypothetical protein